MANVRESFDRFLRSLELTPAEQERASNQQSDLRERLRARLPGWVRDVLVGSYARRTAIRPLNDIDIFVELDKTRWAERRSAAPVLLLEDVQRELRACYGSTPPTTRIQGRSVNIDFAGTGIGYDIIPAFKIGGTVDQSIYEIPDRSQQVWIKTNPESHRQRCVDANERAGGMLNRLIKAAKHWNCIEVDGAGSRPLRSFHLEAMAYRAFDRQPSDERTGLLQLFRSLRDQVAARCPDPAGLGPDLDADRTAVDRARMKQALARASDTAAAAIQFEQRRDDGQAIRTWHGLLGPSFPG